ncbi:kinase-like domain-containing protein, partial [Chytriomyces cf. hyalinus JEL632]
LSEPVAWKVFAQVALAVQHLHANGIVYRDIKDVNIVIDPVYNIKLIDFGCAECIPKSQGQYPFASPEVLHGTPCHAPQAEIG